jgi:hypothetical protein
VVQFACGVPLLIYRPVPEQDQKTAARCQPLDGTPGAPAIPDQRKARREYENRVIALI